VELVKTETAKAFTVKDWQKRVLIERSELEERLGKLEEFLKSFASAEGHEASIQGLSYLDLQRSAMQLYLYTLNRRIELFE
jgi:hypothetical protein